MVKRSQPQRKPSRHSSDQLDPAKRMRQPLAMRTAKYQTGTEVVNGHDAWALYKACAVGDVSKVQSLIDKDARLVNTEYWYQFPIHFAVRAGHVEIVRLLLEHRADAGLSTFTYDSWPKLLKVARERGYEDIERCIIKRLKKDFRYDPDFEVLREAIISRNPRAVASVLRRHQSLIKAADALGNNALHWSIITRQISLVEKFIDLGTPIEAQRANGQSPLLLATTGAYDYWYRDASCPGHPSLRNTAVLVGMLLAKGARYGISTAAAMGDQEQVARVLKKDPARAGQLDTSRKSPLSYAAAKGHTQIVQQLLEHGADPNIPEEGAPRGLALFNACMGNHRETAEVLLKAGADPNAGADSSGCCLTICNAYHGAAAARSIQKLLRSHGAVTPPYVMKRQELKQAIRDNHPATSHEEFHGNVMAHCDKELLDLYLSANPSIIKTMDHGGAMALPEDSELTQTLIMGGLNVNQRDWVGRTFLHRCAEDFDISNAEVLLDGGADIDARDVEYGETPLVSAIRSEPWCRSESQKTAIERERFKMVKFLLSRGAAITSSDDPDWASAIPLAHQRGLTKIAKLLGEHET